MAFDDEYISDFNYRLLNDLLCNREMEDLCVYCNIIKENNENLNFEMWKCCMHIGNCPKSCTVWYIM
jgi:hypothetical protein